MGTKGKGFYIFTIIINDTYQNLTFIMTLTPFISQINAFL